MVLLQQHPLSSRIQGPCGFAEAFAASHPPSVLGPPCTQPVAACGCAHRQRTPAGTRARNLHLLRQRPAQSCRRQHTGQSSTQCSAAAHSAAAAAAAVHSANAATQSAAAHLFSAVQVPPGRDVAAMLFAAAGAVAWVKLFDYFARHDLLEQVRIVRMWVLRMRNYTRECVHRSADHSAWSSSMIVGYSLSRADFLGPCVRRS